MAHKQRLPAAKHLQSVIEWRYPRSHRYWDDCGKLISAVEAEFPGLVCKGLENEGFRFAGRSAGVTGAFFYWDKASIVQAGLGDASMPTAARRFWPLVSKGLGISKVDRIGHRTWLCFPTNTPKDATRWLEGFELWSFSRPDVQGLGTPTTVGVVTRTVLEAFGRRLRMEINPGSFSIEKEEHTGVIVDVDIVREPPAEAEGEPEEFVTWNLQFLRDSVEPLFRSR